MAGVPKTATNELSRLSYRLCTGRKREKRAEDCCIIWRPPGGGSFAPWRHVSTDRRETARNAARFHARALLWWMTVEKLRHRCSSNLSLGLCVYRNNAIIGLPAGRARSGASAGCTNPHTSSRYDKASGGRHDCLTPTNSSICDEAC